MARRKLTRLDSCSATPCATSCASDSGLFTSRMFSCTCLPVSFSSSAADPVGLGALAADDDARTGGVDVDPDPVTGALDVHLGDAGALQALGHHPTDLDVLSDVVLVELVRVPAGLPLGADAEPEPVRVDLLTHYSVPSSASAFGAAFLAAASSPAAFFGRPVIAVLSPSSTVASRSSWPGSSASSFVGLAALVRLPRRPWPVALAAPRPPPARRSRPRS